jgi:hypothetical protein
MRLGAGRSAPGSFNDQVGAEHQQLRCMQAKGVGCPGIARKDENGAIAKGGAIHAQSDFMRPLYQWGDILFANAVKM